MRAWSRIEFSIYKKSNTYTRHPLFFQHFNMRFLFLPLFSLVVAVVQARSIRKRGDMCNDSNLGHFITPNTVTGDQASRYCHSLGGRLADIDVYNLAPLTALVNNCLGPSSRIRVQTWDTNTFGVASLAMFTGSMAGYGTVSVVSNGEALYALCAITTHDNSFSAQANNDTSTQQMPTQEQQENGQIQE